jgi:hypothetical protein
MSLQPHARLMHHTTHSATDTRRIVGAMASWLPFQAQRQERDLQVSCRGGRGRGSRAAGGTKAIPMRPHPIKLADPSLIRALFSFIQLPKPQTLLN